MTGAIHRAHGSEPGSEEDRLTIGEVLAELQPEFADLSHSKVRFLEDQGLVLPERSASGYRKFAPDDVERIRLVLRLQRDHYWPLKKIREALDRRDRGLDADLPPELTRPVRVVGDLSVLRGSRLQRDELAHAAGISEQELADLEAFGLIEVGDLGEYDGDAVEIAALVRELAGFGLEPRHLRIIRTAAERELGLIEQVTAPIRHRRDTTSTASADETAREVSALCLRLHARLVRSGLSRRR